MPSSRRAVATSSSARASGRAWPQAPRPSGPRRPPSSSVPALPLSTLARHDDAGAAAPGEIVISGYSPFEVDHLVLRADEGERSDRCSETVLLSFRNPKVSHKASAVEALTGGAVAPFELQAG